MSRSLHIRFFSACLTACLLAAVSVPLPRAAATELEAQSVPTFTVRGTGFGHGIGMSQYGAQGSALAGKDYRWILGRYYSGTTVAAVPAKTVRVNVDPGASSANAGFTRTSWRLRPGQAGQRLVIGGVPSMEGTYTFAGSGSSIVVTAPNGSKTTLGGSVTVSVSGGNPPLLEVAEPSGIYGFSNTKYRGNLVLSASGGRIKMLNVLPMEWYLYGVVPRESISSWHPEALKAQAVAARSYAYVSTGELFCTTWSQAYQGYGARNSNGVWVGEAASTNAAVDATRDQVVRYGSRTVQTFYFSHSGGHTANNEDVWVAGTPMPELRGVPDIYEHLATPPYAPWPSDREVTLTGSQLADRLRPLVGVPASPAYVTGANVDRAASGHARYVTFRFSNGASVKVTGSVVRTRLGLLSTNFRFTGFPITRIQGSNRYGTAAAVSVRAFPTSAPAVVIASGEDYADALTGSGLAGTVGGPLLLTARGYLPAETAAELARLAPATVYVMGGTAAVSGIAEAAIAARLPGAEIVRVDGIDRYDTARKAAELIRATSGGSTAIVASGTSWPDAASASALAYARKIPILLTPKETLDADTSAYLGAARPSTVLVVGGPAAISTEVQAEVAAASGASPRRLAGSDRYATSAEVARYAMATTPAFTASQVYIATGVEYADALAGGVLAGVQRKPLVLTNSSACFSGTATFLEQNRSTIGHIFLLGGPGAICERGRDAIDEAMMR